MVVAATPALLSPSPLRMRRPGIAAFILILDAAILLRQSHGAMTAVVAADAERFSSAAQFSTAAGSNFAP
jgi:hypothetical protein